MEISSDRLTVLKRHLTQNKTVSATTSKVAMADDNPVTCHVLDTATGKPAAFMNLSFSRQNGCNWQLLTNKITNDNGRAGQFISKEDFTKGTYKMLFDTGEYFRQNKTKGFYPYVEIVFEIENPNEHYHIPLLISPYGYTTYRGS